MENDTAPGPPHPSPAPPPNDQEGLTFTSEPGGAKEGRKSRGCECAERVKFEDVVRGVVSSPAGINACRSKDFDHVGEAEIHSVRRSRSQCGGGDVGG